MGTLPPPCALERAAARAWPATVELRTPDGWLLRATPGLDRGRSNHALTPCREVPVGEIAPALERVKEFAREHSMRAGIQVSPLAVHDRLQRELDALGWATRWPALVLAGPAGGPSPSDDRLGVLAADHAADAWLSTWARCEPERDVEAHAATVFALLRGRATFAWVPDVAVAIGVEDRELLGLYCVAVAADHRREGIGTLLVRHLLSASTASTAYLQVEEDNAAAIAMYERLGFREAYRYCHRVADGATAVRA